MFKSKIQEQSNLVRAFINEPWKHYELRQNVAKFSQLCSSLDVIEDTEEAIVAYENKEFGESKSAHYLAVYGFLQAIYVQQDAVVNLCESLGIQDRISNYSQLKDIREIRNDTVGHPTKRDRRKGHPVSYHHISRITLDHSGFTLASYFGNGSPAQFKEIKIPEIIIEQRRYISTIIATIIQNLEAEANAHKERFRMEKLTEIFPETLGYNFEKLFEGINREDYAEFANLNLEQISNVVQHFLEAVGQRDMDFHESLQHDYGLIEHAISYLDKYYGTIISGEMAEANSLTAEIFAKFLRRSVFEFKGYAQEIDDQYAE